MRTMLVSVILVCGVSFHAFAQGNTVPNSSPTASKPLTFRINTDEYYTWFHGQVHSTFSEHGAIVTLNANHGEFSARDLTFNHIQAEISNVDYRSVFSVFIKNKLAIIRVWRISGSGVRTFPQEAQLDAIEKELLTALRTKAFVKPD